MTTRRGMIREKCRICNEVMFRQPYEIDQVHRCINTNGSQMTTRTDFEKIPSRTNIKFDKKHFLNLGLDPYPKGRSKRERRNSVFYETDVYTHNEFND